MRAIRQFQGNSGDSYTRRLAPGSSTIKDSIRYLRHLDIDQPMSHVI